MSDKKLIKEEDKIELEPKKIETNIPEELKKTSDGLKNICKETCKAWFKPCMPNECSLHKLIKQWEEIEIIGVEKYNELHPESMKLK